MLPKLLVGSVVWLIGWFHKRICDYPPQNKQLATEAISSVFIIQIVT